MKTLKLLMGLMMVCYISLNTLSAQTTFQVTLTATDPGCGLQDGSIQTAVTGGTAPFIYKWYDRADVLIASTQDLTGVGIGIYSVSVTDANSVTVWENATLSNGVTATTTTTQEVCGRNDGTATVIITGGTAPYHVLWEDGQTTLTATGLASGQYDLDVTDANGCVASLDTLYAYVSSYNPIGISSTVTESLCSNANGSATLQIFGAGVAPYSYYWNTVPVQTGVTATNLASGTYTVLVTDATGCSNTGYVVIAASSGTLTATATETNATCGVADGSLSVTPSGGTAPYTYLWDDGSTASSRIGLSRGPYDVTISDNGGCSFTKYMFVYDYSPVSVGFTSTPAACDHTSGSLTATAYGGTAPYIYGWGWRNISTSTLTNISEGYYSAIVTDANGCVGWGTALVPLDPSCINAISGKVYQDANANCVQDAGEYPITNHCVLNTVVPGYSYYGVSDVQGDYTIYTGLGNYTEQLGYAYPNHTVVCPAGGQHLMNGTTGPQFFTNKDFALQPISPRQDVSVNGYLSEPRPGFQHYYVMWVRNQGTTPASGSLVLKHDANEVFLSAAPSGTAYNSATQELTFSYTNLGLGAYAYFYVFMQLPATVPIGTILVGDLTATNSGGDDNLANNTVQIKRVVVGSFDPNDIAVSPAGSGAPGYITTQDDELSYLIRFQNTGTASANFIKVINTLDADLNPGSLHDIVASHPYTLTVRNNNILEFYFENINLPDSTSDYEGSNGFISYKVNQNNSLPFGTEITNNAFIYFDYNAPVETNTVLNTITSTLAVVNPAAAMARHKAYPVPAHDQLIIQSEVNYESVQVMDLTGRVVKSTTSGGNTFEMNVNDLAPGVYIYKIFIKGEAPMAGKVIVE